MDIKSIAKWPKRQLVKLAVDRGLVDWEKGNRLPREEILSMLSK